MKKRFLLAAVLFVFVGSAASAQGFNYGLKASLLFSTIQGNGLKSKFTPGFQGGAFVEYDFSKKWGIQPELLFTQASTKKNDEFNGYYVSAHNTNARDKIKLSYVTVPLLLRYNPIKNLTFNLGAQYSYLFYANENLIKANRDAFKKSDIGAVAGVQVNVANVRFTGRYVLGITNVNDIDDRYKWKSQQIAIGIAVAFK
jgi:hypothetical protein